VIDLHGDPDFTNDQGVKWWKKSSNGLVWMTELPDGTRKFVVIDDGSMIYESDRLVEAGTFADFRVMSKILTNKKEAQ
jgi:hypothetical protein